MEYSDIEHMAQGYPPAHIGKDCEEVITWLAAQLLANQEQRDALAAEVVNIREQAEHVYAAGYNHGHLNTFDGIAYAPGIKDEFYHNALQVMLEVETPATDAYLNSVRAEGVDMAAMKIRKATGAFKDIHHGAVNECADIAEMVAAQLRAAEPS